jgi:hypothetical protein
MNDGLDVEHLLSQVLGHLAVLQQLAAQFHVKPFEGGNRRSGMRVFGWSVHDISPFRWRNGRKSLKVLVAFAP